MVWENCERGWEKMNEETLTTLLKRITVKTVDQDLPVPPGGRFRVMAREAMMRRSSRLFQESLIFLGSAILLLVMEFLLLGYSGQMFLILQGLAIAIGVFWLIVSIQSGKRKEHGHALHAGNIRPIK
jgi:hypothetical protein